MPVFQNINGKLKKLGLVALDREKSLQKLLEENLPEVLDMDFLYSEYPTTDRGRIDTLAIDADGTPVIIEYKKSRNDNVINQALSYLKWLKSQKVEFFEMMVTRKLGEERAKRIDWNNPRILCIAESYSKFDIDTLEVIPLKLELYRYRYYENNIFTLEKANSDEEKSIQVTKSEPSSEIDTIEKKVIEYSLEDHLKKAQPFVKELFFTIQSKIFEIDENIQERITSIYIGYKVSNLFAEVHVQKNGLSIHLRPISYESSNLTVIKVPDSYRWKLNMKIFISSEIDIEYAMPLIEQSYKDVL